MIFEKIKIMRSVKFFKNFVSFMVFVRVIFLILDLYILNIFWEVCSLFFCFNFLFVKLMDNKVLWGSLIWRFDFGVLVCIRCKVK